MQQKYYIFIGILILAFFAGIFSYPNYFNQGIDYVNNRLSWTLPYFPEKPYVLGLDLQGGVSLIYQADLTSVQDKSGAMSGLRDVIERRVNMFGVSEPVVEIQGQDRLSVQLPGVTNIEQAIQMIGQTPYLEFSEQKSEEEIKYVEDVLTQIRDVQLKEGSTLQDIEEIKDWQFALQGQAAFFKPTELTGKYLSKATVIFDQTTYKPEIQLQFDGEGDKIFAEITGRNIKKPIAIFLDGYSIIDTNGDGQIDGQDLYAPIVQDKITGGKAVITGDMSNKVATSLASRLNSGALPVKIGAPISQETVGPTLGAVSVKKSLTAGLFGLMAVVIFMVVIYRLPGLVASISLLIYIAIVLSIFKLVPVTMSLSGIGGIILSVGMAVDANVLIFSRLKEELKEGKGLGQSISEGFRRAWPSIRDGNFTTILVAGIFFFMGTSFIKGFALTLSIGIVISIFSATVVTRNLLVLCEGTKLRKWLWLWS